MTALVVPGPFSLPPGWSPARFVLHTEQTETYRGNFRNDDVNQRWCVLGIDLTQIGLTSTGPTRVDLSSGGAVFYHDAQSIGEGEGITFAWRGMFLWNRLEILSVAITSQEPHQTGVLIWGMVEGETGVPPQPGPTVLAAGALPTIPLPSPLPS